MYNPEMRYLKFIILASIVTACTFPKANPELEIQRSVAGTLASLPTSVPPPIVTPYPSPTPFDLSGLFCEYQFCMGHPVDMAFYDVSAQQNLGAPSTYSQGLIAAFNSTLFIQMAWQTSPGAADPQFMLDLILDKALDTRFGNLEVKQIREMNLVYTPITSTATALLPHGAAAAWICGDRAFAWKVYTPDDQSPPTLFENSFNRFRCNR